jgi:RimJ/RimL family protein N-acetyltransferase
VFEGQLVRLRLLDSRDLPDLLRFGGDYAVQRVSSDDEGLPLPEDRLAKWLAGLSSRDDLRQFGVETVEHGRLIGTGQLAFINWRCRSACLGIEIGDRAAWGKGYGPEAIRLLLQLAFDGLGLNRVEIGTYEFNPRALRCFEKAGFVREGALRQNVYREGRFYDEVIMSMLAAEYTARYGGGGEGGRDGDREGGDSEP